jgi:hypothetical protein
MISGRSAIPSRDWRFAQGAVDPVDPAAPMIVIAAPASIAAR